VVKDFSRVCKTRWCCIGGIYRLVCTGDYSRSGGCKKKQYPGDLTIGMPGAKHGVRKIDPTIAELLKPYG